VSGVGALVVFVVKPDVEALRLMLSTALWSDVGAVMPTSTPPLTTLELL
jgi:hypothetical protein